MTKRAAAAGAAERRMCSRWPAALTGAALLYGACRYVADYLNVFSGHGATDLILVFAAFCGLGMIVNRLDKRDKTPAADHELPSLREVTLKNSTAGPGLLALLLAAIGSEFTGTFDEMITAPVRAGRAPLYFLMAASCFMLVRNIAVESEFMLVKGLYIVLPLLVCFASLFAIAQTSPNWTAISENYRLILLPLLLPLMSIAAAVRMIKHSKR